MLKYKFNNKYVVRLLAVLFICSLVVMLCSTSFFTVYAEEGATSGSCGDSLAWSFDAGTLTISGSGVMYNFREPEMAPWYHLRDQIVRVVLPDELNSIGNLAFYGCSKLKSVILPDKVRRIGHYAFAECKSLTVVDLGDGLREIGNAAFHSCAKLDAVRLPSTMQTMGYQAFYRCESLTTITIPRNLTSMGSSAFAYCKNLVKAELNAPLSSLPEWTFYGCDMLTIVVLSDTVSSVENYAFKNCEGLSTVYYSGSDENKETLRNEISEYVPTFENTGHISSGTPSDSTVSSKFTENDDGTVTTENITVRQDDNITIVSTVTHTHEAENTSNGKYSANISVTVESQDSWESAESAVKSSLKQINETYSKSNSSKETVTVEVYIKDGGTVNTSFLEEMSGREVDMTVTSSNGSSWKIECESIDPSKLSGSYDYSHTVSSPTQETREELGTDDCFGLTFNESSEINAEIVIDLPTTDKAYSNAFLYQVEEDGTHTRLQAVAVDQDNKAHFYLGTVDKDTPYVIGLNVPGESTDDVIIPDTLLNQYGGADAVERLQKIDYVITGRTSSWGLSFMQVTWIMLAVLAVCIIVVGIIMFVMNKKRLQRQYAEMYAQATGALVSQVGETKMETKSSEKPFEFLRKILKKNDK